MADYALLGVTSLAERKRLFQLLQSLQSRAPPPAASPAQSPADLALLFSPPAAAADAFAAEKSRALQLMDQIDAQYGATSPPVPALRERPANRRSRSPAKPAKPAQSAPAVRRHKSLRTVRTTQRQAARAAANKRDSGGAASHGPSALRHRSHSHSLM